MEKSGGNFDLSKIRPDPSRSHIFFPLILEHFNRNLAKVLFHLKYKMSIFLAKFILESTFYVVNLMWVSFSETLIVIDS